MERIWDQARIQQLIDDQIEEGQMLEYKAASSLDRTNEKKDEITKDVSAMANAAGGTIIYGVSEFRDPDKKHLPEKIDPVNRKDFSKEWLEQMINNIRPKINDIVIHPVSLDSGPQDVAYVVEIPQSQTAHQALTDKYHKRYNFQVLAMTDSDIRDVMNRRTKPDATAEFGFIVKSQDPSVHHYKLTLVVKNLSNLLVNYFQLEFTFPICVGGPPNVLSSREHIDLRSVSQNDYLVIYRSRMALFPNEERDIGNEMGWDYVIDHRKYSALETLEEQGAQAAIKWTLYADNMEPKKGSKPFSKMHCF